jgi:hypothetical protein
MRIEDIRLRFPQRSVSLSGEAGFIPAEPLIEALRAARTQR